MLAAGAKFAGVFVRAKLESVPRESEGFAKFAGAFVREMLESVARVRRVHFEQMEDNRYGRM